MRLATTVVLDEGWLDFDAMRLQAASNPLPVVGGETYSLTVQIAGQLGAGAGRLLLVTDGDVAGAEVVWSSPAGFDSAGVTLAHTFTALAGAAGVQLVLEAPLVGGWLAVDDVALAQLVPVQVITRSTYMLAGQAVAVRVAGDPDPANNGLFYLYTDHLGSASAMTDASGNPVGEVVRYTPFGDYRSGGPNAITDLGFTGQRENMNGLGLYYYQARFYLPSVGRFLSADTVVPDPANPQSYNRYSYVGNRPLNFMDPDGHDPHWCSGNAQCVNNYLSATMSANGRSGSSSSSGSLTVAVSDEYSGWYRGDSSGCQMCHAAKDTPYTALTNDQMAAVRDRMHEAAFEGTVAMGTGTAIGLTGASLVSAACADGDCTNEGGDIFASISNSSQPYQDTAIPRSFTLSTQNASFYVTESATKHMPEYLLNQINNPTINPAATTQLASQMLLESFNQAVTTATVNGTVYDQKIFVNGWELIFQQGTGGPLPVIIHAIYSGSGGG